MAWRPGQAERTLVLIGATTDDQSGGATAHPQRMLVKYLTYLVYIQVPEMESTYIMNEKHFILA